METFFIEVSIMHCWLLDMINEGRLQKGAITMRNERMSGCQSRYLRCIGLPLYKNYRKNICIALRPETCCWPDVIMSSKVRFPNDSKNPVGQVIFRVPSNKPNTFSKLHLLGKTQSKAAKLQTFPKSKISFSKSNLPSKRLPNPLSGVRYRKSKPYKDFTSYIYVCLLWAPPFSKPAQTHFPLYPFVSHDLPAPLLYVTCRSSCQHIFLCVFYLSNCDLVILFRIE